MVYLMSLFLYFNLVKGMTAWYLFELGLKKKVATFFFIKARKENVPLG